MPSAPSHLELTQLPSKARQQSCHGSVSEVPSQFTDKEARLLLQLPSLFQRLSHQAIWLQLELASKVGP